MLAVLPTDNVPSCILCASFRNLSNLLFQTSSRDLKRLHLILATVPISEGVGPSEVPSNQFLFGNTKHSIFNALASKSLQVLKAQPAFVGKTMLFFGHG